MVHKSSGRSARHYILPWVLLALLGFGSIAALVLALTQAQDRQQAEREESTLLSALDTGVSMVRHDLQDYAKWDDAVRHIARQFDDAWIDDNVTAYLGKNQGYAHVFVVDPTGKTIYAFSHGARSANDAAATLGPAFQDGLAQLHALDEKRQPIVSGFTRAGKDIYVYAAASIVPLTTKVSVPAGPRYALIIAETFDDAYLAQIARSHHLPGLRLTDGVGRGAASFLPIRGQRGETLAHVALHFSRPGSALRRSMMPGFALIMAGVLAIAGVIFRQGKLDLDALRESEGRALHQAHHDSLTGLPNRRRLLEALKTALGSGEHIVLFYMDLDGFKDVNDLYGHGAGDALLRGVTATLSSTAGPGRLVARTGGDEFAILHLAKEEEPDVAASLADAIIAAFRAPFFLAGTQISIGVSIGVVSPERGSASDAGGGKPMSVDELMRQADVAMYGAKTRGKNRWSRYDRSMDQAHLFRRRLEQDLKTAIAGDEIGIVYQPVFTADGTTIASVEALARWDHPVEGAIPPSIFIPLAETTGLISRLGMQVLRRACLDLTAHLVTLSFNLSPTQFWDVRLLEQIETVLGETGFPASRLEIEITEDHFLSRPEAAAAIIDGLRGIGVSIVLDDFGSGMASIACLQRFTFDRVKLDRQFTARATSDPNAREILASMIALVRALRLQVTAEGVETEAEAAILRASGCQYLQGFYFGRPVRLGELDLPRSIAAA